jgi:hypothetical protein
MEIKEIVSYSVLPSSNLLEVSFRTIDDTDEQIRNVEIVYSEVAEYGYELETEDFDLFFDDEDEDEDYSSDDEESLDLDEDELISFLNEYFLVNPEKLPESSVF